jgi:hypothetical protein
LANTQTYPFFFLVYLVFTILQQLMAKAGSKEANFRAFLNGGPPRRPSSSAASQATLFELGHTPIDVWIQMMDIDGDGGRRDLRMKDKPHQLRRLSTVGRVILMTCQGMDSRVS